MKSDKSRGSYPQCEPELQNSISAVVLVAIMLRHGKSNQN